MPLSIFDLDNTLLTDDSDFLWGQFLVNRGIVDGEHYEQQNRRFFEDYERGQLDIDAYLRFALEPLTRFPLEQLNSWRREFVDDVIRPIVAPGAPGLLDKHRAQGDTLLIISATNRFITEPIAELLQVPHLLATTPEMIAGRYTGNYVGQTTYREGKVYALRTWLEEHDLELAGSSFYTDSLNDLPLLEQVDHPVAVNPDATLEAIARKEGWPIMDLRAG